MELRGYFVALFKHINIIFIIDVLIQVYGLVQYNLAIIITHLILIKFYRLYVEL